MNYSLNVRTRTPVSFSDGDIFNYLDTAIIFKEPDNKVGLDIEAVDFSMNFIKNYLKIDEKVTADNSAFEDLVLRMKNYIFLKRHARWLYEEMKDNL